MIDTPIFQGGESILSRPQIKTLFTGCPSCGGTVHPVPELFDSEWYLWCDDCLMSMDSSGGYII